MENLEVPIILMILHFPPVVSPISPIITDHDEEGHGVIIVAGLDTLARHVGKFVANQPISNTT